ncbi:hypothetical protein GW17_00031621 [Ensete ventricosum]|nr:hypothetical protein GW17_00031621 [Ensete ventricosum]
MRQMDSRFNDSIFPRGIEQENPNLNVDDSAVLREQSSDVIGRAGPRYVLGDQPRSSRPRALRRFHWCCWSAAAESGKSRYLSTEEEEEDSPRPSRRIYLKPWSAPFALRIKNYRLSCLGIGRVQLGSSQFLSTWQFADLTRVVDRCLTADSKQ